MSTSPPHPFMHNEPLGGRFLVEREVGRGAVGIVYRAFDEQTATPVALKIIAARGEGSEASRFEREGSVLAELDHPGIVRVVAFGTFEDETPFIAMEWLEGEDLASRQRRKPLTLEQAIEVSLQVATALAAAHHAGVVHRDVKPTNIFLRTSEGDAIATKLVDFGVAAAGDIRLTRSGNMVGTPAYMAPEQARGDGPVDARSDLYSLGATLFELITGRPPHVGPTPIATLARLVTTTAPSLSDFVPDIPPRLDALVAKLLATSTEDRPPNATAVANELRELLADARIASASLQRLEAPPTLSVGTGSRIVTSIVVLSAGTGEAREQAMAILRARDADVVPLGQDGIVAHLGARQAVGDEAGRALDLGLELAKRGARLGVATGRTPLRLSRPIGEVVDRASSLARDATAGQVLADASTAELTRGRFEFQLRPGGSALVREAQIARKIESIGGAPFVGREAELAQIVSAYERCVDDHTPVVVSCTGPPGIGKSRLGREVLARISTTMEPPRLVVVRCESFGRTNSLGVAAEILRGLLRIPKGTTVASASKTIASRLDDALSGKMSSARELVAHLVANEPIEDGPSARDALWLAMTELVLRTASAGATAIVIEDVQWADPESTRWVDHVLGRAQGKPLWALMIVRPTFWKEHPRIFAGRDHVRLDLRPISKRATRAIAKAVLGARATDELLDLIANQSAGSPLFAEELSRLSASGRDATKAPTIEAAIQASIDALEEPLRDATARLSTFGLSGWESGLSALGVTDAAQLLRQLGAAELIVEQAASRFPGATEWAFKHALVREVAYASLDDDAKKQLHAAAAIWLESMGEDAATVARHYELGGELDSAGKHWERATRRALTTSALADAVQMGERALAFATDRPTAFPRALLLDEAYSRLDARASERETAVRALAENVYDEPSEVRAAGAQARYDDARGAGEQIAERLEQVHLRAAALDLRDEEARCAAALASRLAYAGRLSDAEREAQHLLSLAEKKDLPSAAVDAWQTLAIVRQTRGELISALDARRNAVRAAESAGLKVREATLLINVGFALTTIGAKQEARAAIEQGLALAQSIGSQGSVELGRMVLLGWSSHFGADDSLSAQLSEPRAEADAAAAGGWVSSDRLTLGVLFYRGVELLRAGNQDSAAQVLLRTAAEAYRATGMRDLLPVALGEWAEAERRCGDTARSVELAQEAAQLIETGAPSLLNEAPVYLALHDAHVDAGNLREAREAIHRAMAPLSHRVRGLRDTQYVAGFLTQLPHNAALLAAAEAYGLVPPDIKHLLSLAMQ